MQRLLGLDIGERRIGVALSDPLGITAQRLTVIERQGLAHDLSAIAELVTTHQVEAVIVGLPLTMRGETGEQAKLVQALAEQLASRIPCPIRFIDERLTTVQSERALLETDTSRKRRKGLIDQLAAQLILQSYLDGHAPHAS